MFKYFNVEVSTLRTAYRSVFVGFFWFFFGGGRGNHCGWDSFPDLFLSMIFIVTQKSGWVLCVDFVSHSFAGSVCQV